ncbi:hypothetical protein [Faecalibaculum rodentium]
MKNYLAVVLALRHLVCRNGLKMQTSQSPEEKQYTYHQPGERFYPGT